MTALHASSDEVSAWIENVETEKRVLQSQEATISGNKSYASAGPLARCSETRKYSFICECFFMTARVLNLGLLKAFSDYKQLVQVNGFMVKFLATYK